MTTGEQIQKLKIPRENFFFSSISKNYKSLFFWRYLRIQPANKAHPDAKMRDKSHHSEVHKSF
jgi:hypothetical protein